MTFSQVSEQFGCPRLWTSSHILYLLRTS